MLNVGDVADERLCRIEEMERVLEIEVQRTKEAVRTGRFRQELNALIELLKAQYWLGCHYLVKSTVPVSWLPAYVMAKDSLWSHTN